MSSTSLSVYLRFPLSEGVRNLFPFDQPWNKKELSGSNPDCTSQSPGQGGLFKILVPRLKPLSSDTRVTGRWRPDINTFQCSLGDYRVQPTSRTTDAVGVASIFRSYPRQAGLSSCRIFWRPTSSLWILGTAFSSQALELNRRQVLLYSVTHVIYRWWAPAGAMIHHCCSCLLAHWLLSDYLVSLLHLKLGWHWGSNTGVWKHICRGGGSGWVDRCEIQTGLWFLGWMTDRSGYGNRADEEIWTPVQRASNICSSLPRLIQHWWWAYKIRSYAEASEPPLVEWEETLEGPVLVLMCQLLKESLLFQSLRLGPESGNWTSTLELCPSLGPGAVFNWLPAR